VSNAYFEKPESLLQKFLYDDFGVFNSFGTALSIEMQYRCYWEFRTFMEFVKFPQNASVLELGSGTGRWAAALSPYVASYTGVELDGRLVDGANDAMKNYGIDNVLCVEGDLVDYLENCKEKFDLIYSAGMSMVFSDETLEHILSKASGCLKSKGIIVDRSTTSPSAHNIKREGYTSWYRTDAWMKELFGRALAGFDLYKEVRAYPFLRSRFLYRIPCAIYNRSRFFNRFFKNIRVMKIMRFVSSIVERISPSLSIEGEREYDHKFFFLVKK
jgi:SAM-dependent methyltransferase